MSLINEALKKAQRQRNEEIADAPPVPGGGRIVKRGQARSANTILLLGAGAFVLVVLSVVATIFLVNRGSTPPAPSVASAPSPVRQDAAMENPMMAVPSITPPTIAPATSSAEKTGVAPAPQPPAATGTAKSATPVAPMRPLAEAKSPAAEPAQTLPVAPAPAAVSTATPRGDLAAPPVTPALATLPPVETVKPDEGIYRYVDALRITGVKAAGPDSRVLMNDRVYRLNDIVERTLGVRLIKVETNTLTFTDANGAVYVKNF